MSSHFLLFDWVVLLVYMALTVGMGLYFSRGPKTLSKYLFGLGKIPWWAVGISLIATSLSTTSFLGPPEAAFTGNMSLLMYQFGAFASIVLCGKIFIPFIRKHNVQSAYQILEIHFDSKTRMLASAIYCMHVLLRVGVLLYGPSLLLAEILGISVISAIVMIGVIAILYTYFGGMEAVIWTDVLQFLVLMTGSLFIFYYLTGRGDTLFDLWAIGAAQGHSQVFNFSWDLSKADNFWTLGVAVVVVELAIRSTDQQFVQRYLSCKDVGAAQKSNYLSWALGFVFILIFLIIGVLLFGYYTSHPELLSPDTTSKKVFPQFLIEALPPGVTGVLVAGLFAAAMSSLDSALTALSNTVAVDFLPKLKKNFREEDQLKWGRWSVLAFGVLGVLFGIIVSRTQTDLLTTALKYTSLLTGPLLGLFILAWMPKKISGRGGFWGALVGLVSLIPFKPDLVTGILPMTFEPIVALSWPLFPIVTCGVTVVVGWVLGGLLEGKENPK